MSIKTVCWDDIGLFLAVHEAGSLAKGAAALGISQPTATRRLQHLEHQLGVQLFARTRSGVTLTEAGAEVVSEAWQMRRLASRFVESAVAKDCALAGPVCVSAPDGLSAFWLVPRLSEFMDRYPDINLSLDCGLWHLEDDRLVSDIALMSGEPTDPDMVRVPVCTIHYAMFAAPSYLDRFGRPEKLADLVQHRSIYHAASDTLEPAWGDAMRAVETLAEHRLVTNSSATSFNAVRAGLGIAALPTFVMDIAPELEPLPMGKLVSVKMYLCHSDIAGRVPRVRSVLNWIKDVLDKRKTVWFRDEFVDPYLVRQEQPARTTSLDIRLVRPAARGGSKG